MLLCQRDSSLLTADVVLQVPFKSLGKNPSDLSEKMIQALRKYQEIPKLPKIVLPLKYLKQLYKDESDPLFANATRPNLMKMAKSLMKRLFEVIQMQGQCLVTMVSSENIYGGCCEFSESAHGVGFCTDNL